MTIKSPPILTARERHMLGKSMTQRGWSITDLHYDITDNTFHMTVDGEPDGPLEIIGRGYRSLDHGAHHAIDIVTEEANGS